MRLKDKDGSIIALDKVVSVVAQGLNFHEARKMYSILVYFLGQQIVRYLYERKDEQEWLDDTETIERWIKDQE